MSHPIDLTEVQSEPNGSRDGFKPSAKLRARIEKLASYRIDPSWITFQEFEDTHTGNATISKALMSRLGVHIDVAVKRMRIQDDTDVERVLGLAIREVEFLKELSHPNIISFEGFVEDISKAIIWPVVPWDRYGNLKDFIAREKWEISERILLIGDVTKGLAYLHSREPPICHGDLKSLNVVIDENCYAKIIDFGSARRLVLHSDMARIERVESEAQSTPAAAFCAFTKTITLTGNTYSLRWAAPELLLEDRLGLWSDVWALGWIAYEVVTGLFPFEDATSEMAVVERILEGQLPSLADFTVFSHDLGSLMEMCWKNNPLERPTADYCQNFLEMMLPAERKTSEISGETLNLSRLSMLGRIHQSMGDYGKALDYFVEALRHSREWGGAEQQLLCLRALAQLRRLRNEYDMAIALYSEVLEISTTLSNENTRAETLSALAGVHLLRQGHSGEAIQLYSEALKTRIALGDRKGQADALWALANAHRLREEHSEAVQFYSEVLKIRTTLGDRRGKADTLCALADVHRLQGEHHEAIRFYSKALKTRTDFGDRRGRADALCAFALVYQLQKGYAEASRLYSKALKIHTDLGDKRGRADALSGLADVHRLQGQYNEAILFYSEVLAIRTDLGDKKGRDDALSHLAEVNRNQGESQKAIPVSSPVLEILTDPRDGEGRH